MYIQRFFEEIKVGEEVNETLILTLEDIKNFANTTGDYNPIHLDGDFAKNYIFGEPIGHGMWGGAIISRIIGTRLPGAGSIYLSKTFKFIKPIRVGDELTIKLTVSSKNQVKKQVNLEYKILNYHKETLVRGTATVIPPIKRYFS